MFSNPVIETGLYEVVPCDRIHRTNYYQYDAQMDETLANTLFILYKNRLEEKMVEYASVKLGGTHAWFDTLSDYIHNRDYGFLITGSYAEKTGVSIYFVGSSDYDRAIRNGGDFPHDSYGSEFVCEYPAVEEYFRQHGIEARIATYEYDGGYTAHIYVRTTNWSICHHVHHAICAVLPSILYGFGDITDEQKEYLHTLECTDNTAYRNWVTNYCTEHSIYDELTKRVLNTFQSLSIQSSIDGINRRLSQNLSQEEQHYAQLKSLFNQRLKLSDTLAGLKARKAKGVEDEELLDFIKGSKNIRVLQADTNFLYFAVRGKLDNFDPDLYENMRSNEESVLYYCDIPDSITRDNMLTLFDAIFSTERATVKMGTQVRLYRSGDDAQVSYYTTDAGFAFTRGYLQNTHHKEYSCFGGNKSEIETALLDYDLLTAISVSAASVGSINLGDGIVFPHFVWQLLTNREKIIIVDDEEYTVNEAIKKLKEE